MYMCPSEVGRNSSVTSLPPPTSFCLSLSLSLQFFSINLLSKTCDHVQTAAYKAMSQMLLAKFTLHRRRHSAPSKELHSPGEVAGRGAAAGRRAPGRHTAAAAGAALGTERRSRHQEAGTGPGEDIRPGVGSWAAGPGRTVPAGHPAAAEGCAGSRREEGRSSGEVAGPWAEGSCRAVAGRAVAGRAAAGRRCVAEGGRMIASRAMTSGGSGEGSGIAAMSRGEGRRSSLGVGMSVLDQSSRRRIPSWSSRSSGPKVNGACQPSIAQSSEEPTHSQHTWPLPGLPPNMFATPPITAPAMPPE